MHKYNSKQHQHSYSDTSISNPEGFESYAVKHIIGRGSRSVVHLATCTRGRLRGRDVALKFVFLPFPTPALESMHVATTALHKSLHHPAIVALHSEFTTTDYHCLVLELCEGGTLWGFVHHSPKDSPEDAVVQDSEPRRLSEAQLRPILRSIAEGLSHLHTREIVHQAVDAHSVLLTAGGRVKLGGFGRASSISMFSTRDNESTGSTSNDNSHKMSTTERQYSRGVRAELWSLGCLMIMLLTGTPFSEAENGTGRLTHASPGRTMLPKHLKCSKEAEELINALLKHNPDARTPLDYILSLPFFYPTQQTEFLDPGASSTLNINSAGPKMKTQVALSPSCREIQVYLDAPEPSQEARYLGKQHDRDGDIGRPANITKPHLPYRMPSSLAITKPAPNPVLPTESCSVPRSHLASGSSTAASSGIRDAWAKLTTRQKPAGRKTYDTLRCEPLPDTDAGTQAPSLPVKVKRKALVEVGNHRRLSTPGEAQVEIRKNKIVASGLLSPTETHASMTSRGGSEIMGSPSPPVVCQAPQRPSSTRASGNDNTPIPRTNLPTAFQVPPLFPQTHKLAHGQIVVMPSRSLLVDLREGERRKGGRGERVLCISADGQEISVYDAPHLSTPCVLSEPRATWEISALPARYWEAYNFASKFVESVKKRTPWMVWYTAQAKFTLMSNGPQGDVHATFPCPSPGARKRRRADRETDSFTRMRIVLSRARGTVEIARFTGDEWVTSTGKYPAGNTRKEMTEQERKGLECVVAALKVCEVAEAQCVPAGSWSGKSESSEPGETARHFVVDDAEEAAAQLLISPKSEGSKARVPLTIAPRPRRISSAAPSRGPSRLGSGSLAVT